MEVLTDHTEAVTVPFTQMMVGARTQPISAYVLLVLTYATIQSWGVDKILSGSVTERKPERQHRRGYHHSRLQLSRLHAWRHSNMPTLTISIETINAIDHATIEVARMNSLLSFYSRRRRPVPINTVGLRGEAARQGHARSSTSLIILQCIALPTAQQPCRRLRWSVLFVILLRVF